MGVYPPPDERATGKTTNEATKTATTAREQEQQEREHRATNSQQKQKHQPKTRKHQTKKEANSQREGETPSQNQDWARNTAKTQPPKRSGHPHPSSLSFLSLPAINWWEDRHTLTSERRTQYALKAQHSLALKQD